MIVLQQGDLRLVVGTSGEINLLGSGGGLYLGPLSDDADVEVAQTDHEAIVRLRRGAFRIERKVQLVNDGVDSLLHVTCKAVAERTAPFTDLTDSWVTSPGRPYRYRWIPNLRPEENMRAGSHCFRSPVVVVSGGRGWASLTPDFSTEATRRDAHLCALDLAEQGGANFLTFGIEPTRPTRHVFFEVDPEALAESGQTYQWSYHLRWEPPADRAWVLRAVNGFLWRHFASEYLASTLPQTVPFDGYADAAYPSIVARPPFQDFEIQGTPAGGVTAEAAHAEYFRRPHPIVWNQFWFNNQRAAYGLADWASRTGKAEWMDAARRMTSTTLMAPDWSGLWPAIYAYEQDDWWGSIPRLNGGKHRIHLADVSLTGEWLANWHDHIEPTEAARVRLEAVVHRLCALQQIDGSIAPWHDWTGDTFVTEETLAHSAETGAATTFLARMARNYPDAQRALMRGVEFLEGLVMQVQQYQDFETFFSCSPKPLDMTDSYSAIGPQNSLAVYWTARSMLGAYQLTGEAGLLRLASEATDILSLYQQVWNPPFLSLYAFGGFGVMNTDAEWNDARQSLFAPHYFEMYKETGLNEYRQRGQAALRASFALASMPENEEVSPNTFASYAPGLMPENYGHAGRDVPAGRSDTCWGESGALTSVAWLRHKFPDLIEDLD